MCLRDEEPMCGRCKLLGDHQSHQVVKISAACAERRGSFAEETQLVLQRSERSAQPCRCGSGAPVLSPRQQQPVFGFSSNGILFRAPD
ncbi:hypothetical protein HPG69_007904 [Diceros bicornis minor]|uniref:B box-type domain-containing protein n=1 Tax=Diceros bicornis minor TaxID=77932 RepID=A0A7J7EB61_DICBM|nr:hypothetical protein HPG69_007904 [Diceros bicornis minor]